MTYYKLRFIRVMNIPLNNKAKNNNMLSSGYVNSDVLDLSKKTLNKYKDPFFQLNTENICYFEVF